jgi:TPR repeat protein
VAVRAGAKEWSPDPERADSEHQFQLVRRFGKRQFIELSEKAKEGDPAAELELANAFFAGRDIPKDESQGLALLERAAEGGLPQAQFELADRTYGDGNDFRELR